MIDLREKHVLVLGTAPNVKKHWDKIEKFIKDNDIITIGCNNITGVTIPDIHFWGSTKRFRKFGMTTSKKSSVIFQNNFPKKTIRKYWKKKYDIYNIDPRLWKYGSDDKSSYEYKRCCMREKKGVMRGCFCSAGSKAIFWAHMQGATKIMVAGMDGYTYYSKEDLESKNKGQNFFGMGFTSCFSYFYNRKIDWDIYKTLRLLKEYGSKKYGFNFEIITPTIYEEFYNPDILSIDYDSEMVKWKEPAKKEYKQLYFNSKRDSMITGKDYFDYNG